MVNENKLDTEDEISLLDLWNIFKNRFAYFITTVIIVVIAAFLYLQTTIPLYNSSVTVLVDPIQSSSSLDDMLLSGMSSNSSKIQTEVELITSNRNLKSALSLLDLSSYTNSKGESYDSFYKISSKSDAISVTSVKDTNLVSIGINDENAKFAADFANAIANSYDNLLTGIAKTSKTIQREFLEDQIPLNEAALQSAANALSDYKEESGIIQLDKKSASLVTQIAYFDIKEDPLKLNIENNNNLLDSYFNELENNSIVLPSINELTNSKEFNNLRDIYSAANNELIMYNLANSAEFNGNSIYSDTNSVSLNLINAMESASKKMLDIINRQLQPYIGEDIYNNKIISDYSKLILENIKSEIELSLLEERSKVYNAELDKLPVIERRVTELERNVAVLQQVGLDLRSMLEQVKLTEAAVSGNVTVIDEAQIALIPISPNKLLIMAVAILLGMALGFLMCILVNLKDNTINTRDDVKKVVGDSIPLLGWIPLFIKEKKDDSENLDESNSIFVYNKPNSLQAEKVLSITSNLLYGKTFKKNQVIAVNSCDMNAGKSTLLTNIAMSLVRTGAKVIVIDGDLRLPSVLKNFGYSNNKVGLVEVILEMEELKDVIVKPFDDVDGLNVLPVGHKPQIPSSILSYTNLDKIIKILRTYYDYILIDAPPVSYASEVLTIAQLSDSIILNVRANITTKESLSELLDSLVTVQEKISGVVLNGFIPSKSDFGGKTGNYGYNKYSYNNNYDLSDSGENKNKFKIISQTKARRIAVKQYKLSLNSREERNVYFQKIKKYAPVVKNLHFSNISEKPKEDNVIKDKSTFNSSNRDIDKKLSYNSLIENLKKDNAARGKSK